MQIYRISMDSLDHCILSGVMLIGGKNNCMNLDWIEIAALGGEAISLCVNMTSSYVFVMLKDLKFNVSLGRRDNLDQPFYHRIYFNNNLDIICTIKYVPNAF